MIPPGGHIPTRSAQDAATEQTVRAALRALVQRGELHRILEANGHGGPPPANGFYFADGTFTTYCVYGVSTYGDGSTYR